jgi:hypothetical protein
VTHGHEVALWAGVAAFFGSLLTVGIVDLVNLGEWVEYVGALLVALITAGGVYSQQRLSDAKKAEQAKEKARPASTR